MPGKMVKVIQRDKMADMIELQLEKKSKFSLGFKSAKKKFWFQVKIVILCLLKK